MDDEGFLYFVSRKDDIIKSRGEKVAPKEVETVLYSIPGVSEVAVVGVPYAEPTPKVKAQGLIEPLGIGHPASVGVFGLDRAQGRAAPGGRARRARRPRRAARRHRSEPLMAREPGLRTRSSCQGIGKPWRSIWGRRVGIGRGTEMVCSGCGLNGNKPPQIRCRPGAREARTRDPPQDDVVTGDDNSESSPNSILWLWIPDRRAAARRLSGMTAENGGHQGGPTTAITSPRQSTRPECPSAHADGSRPRRTRPIAGRRSPRP